MDDSSLSGIRTPDQRLRVFISSTIAELAAERQAIMEAARTLRLSPVMFELGARPHPPRDLYRAYLNQSDMFVGIYWQSYGWVAPDETVSGIEDEYRLSEQLPRLIYVKEPAPDRHDRLGALLDQIRNDDKTSYRKFTTPEALAELALDDLALLVTERFHAPRRVELPTGTISFLFVDLDGRSQLAAQAGAKYNRLMHGYHSIVADVTRGNSGHVVVVDGSSVLSVFTDAIDAVAAAGEMHSRVATHHWPKSVMPSCRIGIHTGGATRTEFGYVGAAVTHASEIKSAANGGQTFVSLVTKDLIAEGANEHGWAIASLGNYRFDQSNPEPLFRVDHRGQTVETAMPRARPSGQHMPPPIRGKLIGRDHDLTSVAQLLSRDDVRMVSITGAGGTGKTRLAAELTRTLEDEFPGGICFADMSPLRDPSRFMPAIGKLFGVRESTDRRIVDALVTVIGADRVMVVLDNMEQLLASAGELAELIAELPTLKVLVTSRAPLRISWEYEYPLDPLPVPRHGDTLAAIQDSDAVSLFVERARAVRPDFRLTAENAGVLGQISRRLDGLPLAIELAAARLRMFSPEGLLERLEDRMLVLNRGAIDGPERHRTMRGAIEWSLDLLLPDERVVYGRLGAFSGGWTLEAALFVCADERLHEAELLDIFDELVAKSLIVFSIDANPRYLMLETLRELALEELAGSGDFERVKMRHLDWLLTMVRGAEFAKATRAYPQVLDSLERERSNIWSALRWSVETGVHTEEALTLCGFLPLFWETRGYLVEGLRWTERLLDATQLKPDTPGTALALQTVGWLAMLAGDPDRSVEASARADGFWRAHGDKRALAWCLAMSGMTTYNRGELVAARRMFEEAVELNESLGIGWLSGVWCAYGLAHISLDEGDFVEAERLLNTALDESNAAGMTWGAGHAQMSLGVLAFVAGRLTEAIDRVAESLVARRELRDVRGTADCVGMMAVFAASAMSFSVSAQLLGAMDAMREAAGQRTVPWQAAFIAQAEAGCRDALGATFDHEHASGVALGRETGMDLALEWAKDRSLAAPAP